MAQPKRLIRRASSSQPDSPATAKLKKLSQAVVQKQAFNDLLEIRKKNGGSTKYGDYEKVKNKYHLKGFTFVNVDNLHYRMKNFYKSGKKSLAREFAKPSWLIWLSNGMHGNTVWMITISTQTLMTM
jgi:hypothetical protein